MTSTQHFSRERSRATNSASPFGKWKRSSSARQRSKFYLIFDLVSFDAAARIQAMRNALMVNNDRARLVYDFISRLPHLKCEIAIFAISRSIAFVEAA